MASLFRDRPARRLARWVAPSVVAACAGALAAGGYELLGDGETGGALGLAATVGFLVLAGAPMLFAASALARVVGAAWQPQRLAARLVEDGGGAPVLAAWATILWLATLALAGALFQGIWILSNDTAWKAITVSLAVPLIAVGALVAMAVLAWPVARVLIWLYRRVDAAWRRRGHHSLLAPWRIAAWVAAATVLVVVGMWFRLISPHIGPFDTSLFLTPILAVAVTAGVHALWAHVSARVRLALGAALGALALAVAACAVVAAHTSPSVTLAIWGDRPFAGFAIEQLYDLDDLRAGVSLAELAPTVARPGAAHPDIVLVTIDTVRADHTPPYGGRADMPGLRQLGQLGAVFDFAFSPSNVTRRSIPSMVIGLPPNRVHGRVVGSALRVDPRHVLLAERMLAGGYETAGFMCCEGFWGPSSRTGLQRGLEHLEIEKTGLELAKRARTWLDEREQQHDHRPLFLWMHIIEPHDWTSVSGEGRNDDERRRFYDRSLATADQALVTLLGAFANRPPDLAPIVIVTSDHGEALGEHGQPYHSTDLYDAQTHVPLVIAGPGIHPGHIIETVSLVDLVPTVMELAGFVAPSGLAIDGHSLAGLAAGHQAPDPDGGIAFLAQIKDRSNAGGIEAVVRGRWKLISNNGKWELYDVHGDSGERINLVHTSTRATIAGELRTLLQQHDARGRVSPFP